MEDIQKREILFKRKSEQFLRMSQEIMKLKRAIADFQIRETANKKQISSLGEVYAKMKMELDTATQKNESIRMKVQDKQSRCDIKKKSVEDLEETLWKKCSKLTNDIYSCLQNREVREIPERVENNGLSDERKNRLKMQAEIDAMEDFIKYQEKKIIVLNNIDDFKEPDAEISFRNLV